MNCRLLLLMIACIGALHVNAQHRRHEPVAVNAAGPERAVLPPASSHGTEKTTVAASRLIGSFYGYGLASGVIRNSDSTAYVFSGSRGGDLNTTIYQYDSRTYYSWDTVALIWKPTTRNRFTYNGANKLSSETDEKAVSGVWTGTTRYTYTKDASGADTLVTADTFSAATSSWKPYYNGRYTNNAAGKPLTVYYSYWSNATMSYSGLIQRTTYVYDAMGNNTSYTVELYTSGTGTWRNSYRLVYTYNAAGKVTYYSYQTWNTTTSAWAGDQYNYYYNSSNHPSGYSYQASLTAASSDSASYSTDAAGNIVLEIDYTKSGSTWTPTYRYTDTYSPTNKTLTYIAEQYSAGTFRNYSRGFYFYNSFDQLTRFYQQNWNGTAWVTNASSYEDRYYYENYNAVGVSGQKLSANDVMLYPVPAAGTINIAVSFGPPQAFTAVMSDAAGRIITQWNDATAGGLYTHSFAIAGLPNGIYHLSIRGRDGAVTRTFSVLH